MQPWLLPRRQQRHLQPTQVSMLQQKLLCSCTATMEANLQLLLLTGSQVSVHHVTAALRCQLMIASDGVYVLQVIILPPLTRTR